MTKPEPMSSSPISRTSSRVLVTGGEGFLGSAVIEYLLNQGRQVRSFDISEQGRLNSHPGLERRFGSVVDTAAVEASLEEVGLVYHLAAAVGVDQYISDPAWVLDTNILGTRNLVTACRQREIPLVLVSTSEVYGKNTEPLHESADSVFGSMEKSRWSYALSKAVGEQYLHALGEHGEGPLPYLITRIFNAYGPLIDDPSRSDAGRVLSKFIGALQRNEPLRLVDEGRAVRSFLYIDDAAEALARLGLALEAGKLPSGGTYNIGRSDPISIRELADMVLRLSGSQVGSENIPGERFFGVGFEEIPYRVPDVSRLEEDLGFKARISLEEGLRRTLDHWGLLNSSQKAAGPAAEMPESENAQSKSSELQVSEAERSEGEEVESQGSGLPGSGIGGSGAGGSEIRGSELGESEFERSESQGSEIKGSGLPGSGIGGSELGESEFERSESQGSELEGSGIQGSEIGGSEFQESEIEGSEFKGSKVRSSELRESELKTSKLEAPRIDAAQFKASASSKPGNWLPAIRPVLPADGELLGKIQRSLKSGWVSNEGPVVRRFESRMAEFLGVEEVIATSSGTAALQLLFHALELPQGSVILPSFTYIASLAAFSHLGLEPVFCDVNPADFTLCPKHLAQLLDQQKAQGKKVVAVVPVNVYGVPAHLPAIRALCDEYGALLIYDNAHGLGSEERGVRVPVEPLGQAFSLHATKVLPAVEGGLVVSGDASLRRKLRRLRSHGIDRDDLLASTPAFNARMDELRAAVGESSLSRFHHILKRRRLYAERLRKHLVNLPGFQVQAIPDGLLSNHQNLALVAHPALGSSEAFSAREEAHRDFRTEGNSQELSAAHPDFKGKGVEAGEAISRKILIDAFAEEGVEARAYFHPLLHQLHHFSEQPTLPVSEMLARHLVVLPLYSQMTENELQKLEDAASRVAEKVHNQERRS